MIMVAKISIFLRGQREASVRLPLALLSLFRGGVLIVASGGKSS